MYNDFVMEEIFLNHALPLTLVTFSIDKIINAYFKLAYAAPRPYMIASHIRPLSCSTSFGMPSGHSSAAFMITITIFLDIFHGAAISKN